MYRVEMTLKEMFEKRKMLLAVFFTLFLTACKECPTIQDYLNDGLSTHNNCLLCRLFKIITEAATSAATKSWDTFHLDLIPLVVLASAIYIAMAVLKNVGSFGKQNAADFLTGDKKGILILMFKTTVIVLLLQENESSSFFINKIISPILQAGLNIGSTLSVEGARLATPSGTGYAAIFEMVNEAVKQFNDQLYRTIAIGEAMICNSIRGTFNIFKWYWLMLFYGFILFVFGWVLLVGISFYIVDILIRLTFGAILLPFGVAAAISGLTSTYSKNIWSIFLNVFASFVMLGIVMGLSMQLVDLCMGSYESGSQSPALNSFLTNLSANIDDNQVKEIAKELWSNGSLLFTIVCFCVIVQLAAHIGKLADKIADSGTPTSAGSQVGAAVMKPVSGAGKRIAKATGNWGLTASKRTGAAAARMTRLDKAYAWGGNKVEEIRGTLTGTGRQGYRAFWHKAQTPLAAGPLQDVVQGDDGSTITRNFDANHRLRNVQTVRQNGDIEDQSFDENGNLETKKITHTDGSSDEQTFHGNGQVASEKVTHTDGSSDEQQYDADGKPI